jgi:GTPase SAR1 family protein
MMETSQTCDTNLICSLPARPGRQQGETYAAELQQRVEALFQYALKQTTGIPGLHAELSRCHQRLQQPMRVAVVGKIKAGKSTFMNALLEEKVVETGAVETTFNVNWLRFGPQRSLTVYYKDEQHRPEQLPYDRLAELTKRSDDPEVSKYLRSIKYIRVSYPNPILRAFDLIDTPGLESTYEDDARNTLDFIMQYGKELTATTQEEAGDADAVLYLFSKGLGESDSGTLKEFQGEVIGQARPFNAIGVLTKVDANWKTYDDPVQGTQAITKRLAGLPQVRRLFYSILPIAGLLGFGAKTMTAEEFETLLQIAALPPAQFRKIAQSKDFFVKDYPFVPVPQEKRKQLTTRLEMYGINLAYRLINEQGIRERKWLMEALYERSGLLELRQLILSHFGSRAYLIKLSSALSQLENAFIEARQQVRGREKEVVLDLAGKFQMIRLEEHAFQEIEVLGSYYEGKLVLTAGEAEQLLQVTGECGTSYYERLGMPENATKAELQWAAETRLRYWKEKANDVGFDRSTPQAADVLAQSYNRIVYELSK